MTWLLIGVLAWIALALPLALVLARSIRHATVAREAEEEADARALAALPGETSPDRPAPDEAPRAPADSPHGNFIVTEPAPLEVVDELPWTGPSTRPFPPPPSVPRRRPHPLPGHVTRPQESPSNRDTGVR
jgi:hypothetical protein